MAGYGLITSANIEIINVAADKIKWRSVYLTKKMSCNYADGLSPYPDKGLLGLDEKFDSKSVVGAKVSLLAKWMGDAKHIVIHTGAGISTSSGIPDFRGPRGVWTLQSKGQKPDPSTDFNEAIPTPTHMAIAKLVEKHKVKYVVSQNIDGLHLRSNVNRKFLSELHGNMFIEQCNTCNRQFVRSGAVPTVGQKNLGKPCPTVKSNGRPCRGRLHDTILDWEHSLPENDLGMADFHSCMADLSICLGTTMQIVPSGNLPLYTKKHGGKLVICNLQPTKHDRKADLLIHAYVDEVMIQLMKFLNFKIPKYSIRNDPTKTLATFGNYLEWTISDDTINKMRKVYEEKCGSKEAKKRLEMIDDEDDLPLKMHKGTKRSRAQEKEEEPELEVVNVIVKPKKGKEIVKEAPKRGLKRTATTPAPYASTITVKKVVATYGKKTKEKFEKVEKPEKITIKKNVTPTKTKYEIVQPRQDKVKKTTATTTTTTSSKCEIVYSTTDVCEDLEMICESDDDDMSNNFTTNFKRYLYGDKEVKTEENKKDIEKVEVEDIGEGSKCVNSKGEVKEEGKEEIKENENESGKNKQSAEEKNRLEGDDLRVISKEEDDEKRNANDLNGQAEPHERERNPQQTDDASRLSEENGKQADSLEVSQEPKQTDECNNESKTDSVSAGAASDDVNQMDVEEESVRISSENAESNAGGLGKLEIILMTYTQNCSGEAEEITNNCSEVSEISESCSEVEEITDNRSEVEEVTDNRNEVEQITDNRSEVEEITDNRSEVEEITDNRSEVQEITDNRNDVEEIRDNRSEVEEITDDRSEVKEISENCKEVEELTENRNDADEKTEVDFKATQAGSESTNDLHLEQLPNKATNAPNPTESSTDADIEPVRDDIKQGSGATLNVPDSDTNIDNSAETHKEVTATDAVMGLQQSDSYATDSGKEASGEEKREDADKEEKDAGQKDATLKEQKDVEQEQDVALFSSLIAPSSSEFSIEQFVSHGEPSLNLPEPSGDAFSQEHFLDKELVGASNTTPDMDYVENLQQFLQ